MNLGFRVGRSNNINSFIVHMLLIQYLQFGAFSSGCQFAFGIFWPFLHLFLINFAVYSFHLFL